MFWQQQSEPLWNVIADDDRFIAAASTTKYMLHLWPVLKVPPEPIYMRMQPTYAQKAEVCGRGDVREVLLPCYEAARP